MQRKLLVVMRPCSPVVLSHLDTGFEPRCGRKDFWIACFPLLLALEHQLTNASKTPIIHPKWTTEGRRGAEDAFFITHLPSFDTQIAMEAQRPSLQEPTWHTSDRPYFSGRLS